MNVIKKILQIVIVLYLIAGLSFLIFYRFYPEDAENLIWYIFLKFFFAPRMQKRLD